ncbi:GSCFA domain-containing protein [Siphonobacter sp. SORGH_AS_0500]|uniref:GSCFA domain-containing protein n=1 Tax=Siphonobacter sp. SORGH_AS_0500 TaxID=1864824 RepID=UPI00285D9475|nr:GSCFA domain-containing protein [Siphonobacter sp. SORGH_AS_0500]MDR6195741.1 hypothetical protein [Siphonobacter sp. SORGH_AS_0500]
MNFRTEFTIPASDWKINLDSSVVSMGSCFAEVVGTRLQQYKMAGLYQPFGTLFSPVALFKILSNALKDQPADPRLFLEREGQWLHYDFHSSISASNQEELNRLITNQLVSLKECLSKAQVLILTLGSSWVYQLNDTPAYVANCHKQPARIFTKDLLSVKTICKEFGNVYTLLKQINPGLRILLTVSPVRHAKDGMMENSVSKSILRAACHYLITDYQDTAYFPAYELLLDDLRDYRFYETDLVHPSEMAEEYIFEKFQQTYFSKELSQFAKEWQRLTKALNHRPFQPNTGTYQSFLEKLKTDFLQLPVNTQMEVSEIERRLSNIRL